jgi:tetratricopeptide (TPR) repeat protein
MRYFLIVLYFLFSFTLHAQDAVSYYQQAMKKCNLAKNKEALVLLDKAIALDSKNVDYYLLRSYINIKLGNDGDGFNDINAAIKADPRNYKGYARRGEFFYSIKESDKSILDYTSAIKYAVEDSSKIFSLIGRSSSKLLKQDPYGCIQDCKEILLLDSMNTGALNNYAMALDIGERGDEALEMLKRIIKIDSTASYAYMNIGFKLSNVGKYRESLPYFDKTIEMDPKFAYSYNNRGYAKFMLKDFEGALTDINQSIKIDPLNSYAFLNRGLVYLNQGKKNKACEDWDQAIRLGFTNTYGKKVEELIKENCL